jgi:predicted transcriptional regulator
MASKTKTREITLVDEKGTFSLLFKRLYGEKEELNFEGLAALRAVLSNEKARIMHTIKTKNPLSIYHLAKLLGRDFKSVNEDIKLLQRFGFIELVSEKTGKRQRLRPLLSVESIKIEIKV